MDLPEDKITDTELTEVSTQNGRDEIHILRPLMKTEYGNDNNRLVVVHQCIEQYGLSHLDIMTSDG
jgi:hypothetical protein